MQVSQRVHYGLRAMTELAKAYGNGPVSLAEIAEAERLPAGYLEQLAMPLRRAGLIEGRRGLHGGYELAVPPADVTVGAVVRALDGAVAPVVCLTVEYVPGSCERDPVCLSRSVWKRVKDSVDRVLDSITLAELCTTSCAEPAVTFIPPEQIQRLGAKDPCSIAG
ncbi:MAG: Rrf2 family transcriptional regulator [Chloroflexi bacterium]|nr:Rrf2 family transcriptional regulator [Chloroflexota bacterium]